jgi:alkaline phosphatase D
MRVELSAEDGGEPTIAREVPIAPETDFAGHVLFEGLRPATPYRGLVRFTDAGGRSGPPESLRFETAPDPQEAAPVRLAWGGDVAGQNACRDARHGFPIFARVIAEQPALFVGLGDMIYADDECLPVGRYGNPQVPGESGPATDLEGFRAHWRYVRADGGLQRLLATTPYVAVWDDHEVVNDVGPHHDTREEPPYRSGLPLLPLGRRAFHSWNPVASHHRFYRSLRWGRHLELFVLDTRQYRDANFAPDTGPVPKTMLGAAQRRWLEQRMAASDATWKVVVSSVPLSIPTGASAERGRDGWANYDQDTGFERELLGILEAFRQAGVRNLVWITTDVHFAAAFRYEPFPDAPDFRFLEIATGPMNAGLFPNRRYDETLRPQRLLFYAPPDATSVTGFAEASRWFNFGVLDVGADGELTARVVNGLGETVFYLTLAPNP